MASVISHCYMLHQFTYCNITIMCCVFCAYYHSRYICDVSCELYNVCACNFNDMIGIIPLCLLDIIVGTTASRKKNVATKRKDSK